MVGAWKTDEQKGMHDPLAHRACSLAQKQTITVTEMSPYASQ